MPQSQIETLNQTGTDLQSKSRQPGSAATDALGQRFQPALLFLFDHLRVDQFRMWLEGRIPRPSSFARPSKLLDLMVDRDHLSL